MPLFSIVEVKNKEPGFSGAVALPSPVKLKERSTELCVHTSSFVT